MIGPVALDEEDGCFIFGTRHILQRRQRNEQSRSFAVFDDTRDVKVGRKQMQGLPGFDFLKWE